MKHLSTVEIAVIKARILRGDKYSEIAADYRLNIGRLSELKYGKIFPEIPPASLAGAERLIETHPTHNRNA